MANHHQARVSFTFDSVQWISSARELIRMALYFPLQQPRIGTLLLRVSSLEILHQTLRMVNLQTDRQVGSQTGASVTHRKPWDKKKINVLTISGGQECAAPQGGFREVTRSILMSVRTPCVPV